MAENRAKDGHGYLNRVQSSRRLEREAGRKVEVMWLTFRLVPDHIETAEHPSGTLKMSMGATHFLMKRLPKVATEMALRPDRERYCLRLKATVGPCPDSPFLDD